MRRWRLLVFTALALALAAQQPAPPPCPNCAAWNAPQAPFRVYGNTYYVGPQGLSSILITSPAGDILIDGDLAESAPQIAAHIRALGFRLSDVKLILNSHVHYDHAGGIAALAKLTGARVAASPWSAQVLRSGRPAADDPQHDILLPIAPVPAVAEIHDGETLRAGDLAITAHFTPGHTPGGTSWTWRSCQQGRCLDLVYADSLTPVSAPGYRFSDHPALLAAFQRSFAWLRSVPCDILLTPHLGPHPQRDPQACRRLAANSKQQLQKRLATEADKP
ncbi:MAG TPA: subclass B3 metallo-beta-lactamase [Terriglobales bacterium]|nr:subclass B3 metallo-beta-lactamase [Terriglobales bacterium]